ncbi:alpha/beta hydrolase [Motilimonas sp. 1_MG-2023]|uniref:alpha/beta fold hydrolase n=1 Tax=Motilimonas sp. 1_MG-2023 TaxID=3062672 RepID=UPI0026E24CAB|nr:alpha/beta hydrolase [Motilimonas sp. 1_MG-2023]MDO6526200.1 alpha/beta hydrolase [Motilimonas sp. 1_MG-2023]
MLDTAVLFPIQPKLETQFVTLREGALAALAIGEPALPVVLCLHGWLDNAASFVPLLQAFEQQQLTTQFRFVCIDLPGHGHSQHRNSAYHFADWVDDVYQVITVLGERPVILIGHSLGALVASCVAAAFPEKVSHLIMIEGAGPLVQSVTSTTAHLRQAILSRQASSLPKPRLLSSLVQAKQRALGISAKNATLLATRGAMSVTKGYVWRHDPRLTYLSPFRLAESQAQQLIKDIKCPTMCILGNDGYAEISTHLFERQHLFTQLTKVELPGNHHVHMENHLGVAQTIKEYLVKC